MRWIPVAVLFSILTSCSGDNSWSGLGAKCANPRSGVDPITGNGYPDAKGTLDDEKKFLKAFIDDTYLWYSEVPAADPSQYATATDYFNVLKTTQKTASGSDKDRFHFWQDTAEWEQLSQTGVQAGYGVTWALLATRPPRKAVAAYNEPGSPAANQNVTRGVEVITVDGEDVVNGTNVDKLNAGLFPAGINETHTFQVLDVGSTTPRNVTMTSANVTGTPVQNVHTIDTATGKVGYMLFNDHLATAEKGVVNAVTALKAAGIADLVVDIRYNGGGYLDIASELAYMIAGAQNTNGKIFEQTIFNDKHPSNNPVNGSLISPTPFHTSTVGLSLSRGLALPTLNLAKAYVLTGSGTCSASESLLNGLAGANVQVIQVGSTTCGKPYGFYPEDNCGTTYFSIQFKGVNAKGFGDYSDGFVPGATTTGSFAGCKVADDFSHALGDVNEARLAAALAYRQSATCPTPTSSALLSGGLSGEGRVFKSIFQTNRILRR